MRRIMKPAADGSVDPRAMLVRFNALNDSFRNTITNPGARAFFGGVRADVQAAAAGNVRASRMLAQLTRTGLRVALRAGTAATVGGIAGHSLAGAILGGTIELGAEGIVKGLQNPKAAYLLARMLRTPVNSAVVPALVQEFRKYGLTEGANR